MGGAAEVRAVCRLLHPSAVTGRFAGLSAWQLGPGVLAPHVAGVGIKEDLTVLTRALSGVTYHWPASPQVNDRQVVAWKEEHCEENEGGRRGKKREEMYSHGIFRKKTERGYPTFSTCSFDNSFRSPLTQI
jgi:hypothetical protein